MQNNHTTIIIKFPKRKKVRRSLRMPLFSHKPFGTEVIIIAIFLLFIISILFVPVSNAHAKNNYRTEKRIASVKIQENDSLWTIASTYYTKECGSLRSYIAEIKRTNGLSDNVIYAESYLIIPYYVSIPVSTPEEHP